MLSDEPDRLDIVFKSVDVVREASLRGAPGGAEHWENRYSTDITERDVSDHYPLVVDFEFR